MCFALIIILLPKKKEGLHLFLVTTTHETGGGGFEPQTSHREVLALELFGMFCLSFLNDLWLIFCFSSVFHFPFLAVSTHLEIQWAVPDCRKLCRF